MNKPVLKKCYCDKDGQLRFPHMLQLARDLQASEKLQQVMDVFLNFLMSKTNADGVIVFLAQKDKKTFRLYPGTDTYPDAPEEIGFNDSQLVSKAYHMEKWGLIPLNWQDERISESVDIFVHGCETVTQFPLFSVNGCLGIVKLDSQDELTYPKKHEDSLELISYLVTSHLDDMIERQELIQEKTDHWFEHTQIKLRDWEQTSDIFSILHKQLDNLREIDPNLITSWRYYFKDDNEEMLIYRETIDDKFHKDQHYGKSSHIASFIDSKEKIQLYTEQDIKTFKPTTFSGLVKAALLFNTTIREIELSPQSTKDRQPIVCVISSGNPDFLHKHKDGFKKITDHLSESFKNAFAKDEQKPVDERYLRETQEILERLLRQNNSKSLIRFVLKKMLEVAPETNSVSFGRIEGEDESAWKLMLHDADGKFEKNYLAAYPLNNGGLWQHTFETSSMVVVNNRHAVDAMAFNNLPIEDARSALCVPVYNKEHEMAGIISLCSSQINAYTDVEQGIISWLAQAFSAQLHEIEEREKLGKTPNTSNSKELDCIGEIIRIFNLYGTGTTADYTTPMFKALREVASVLGASSWALFERSNEVLTDSAPSGLRPEYRIMEQHSLHDDYEHYIDGLPYSPVHDLLKPDSDELFLLKENMTADSAYKKLIPLLNGHKSCIAIRIEIQREPTDLTNRENVSNTSQSGNSGDSLRSKTYGLFLFHFQVSFFQAPHVDFLQMSVILIQELIQRQTLSEDLRRLMPSALQGTMSAQIAHEIKNPCVPLESLVNIQQQQYQQHKKILQEAFPQPKLVDDTLNLLKTCSTALARIRYHVNNLMRYSNLREQNPTQLSLIELMQELATSNWYDEFNIEDGGQEQELVLRSEDKIRMNTPSTLVPEVEIDRYHMVSALMNLIKNALYAIKEAKQSQGEIMLGVNYIKDADYPIQIIVSDNGSGMPRRTLNRIFDPFFTTKTKGGTGLGCTIVKMFIEQMGGTIGVESIIGKGTTFTLLLPQSVIVHSETLALEEMPS